VDEVVQKTFIKNFFLVDLKADSRNQVNPSRSVNNGKRVAPAAIGAQVRLMPARVSPISDDRCRTSLIAVLFSRLSCRCNIGIKKKKKKKKKKQACNGSARRLPVRNTGIANINSKMINICPPANTGWATHRPSTPHRAPPHEVTIGHQVRLGWYFRNSCRGKRISGRSAFSGTARTRSAKTPCPSCSDALLLIRRERITHRASAKQIGKSQNTAIRNAPDCNNAIPKAVDHIRSRPRLRR